MTAQPEDLLDCEVDELLAELKAADQKAAASDLYRRFLELPEEQRRAWAETVMPSMLPNMFAPMKMDVQHDYATDSLKYRMDWSYAPAIYSPKRLVTMNGGA